MKRKFFDLLTVSFFAGAVSLMGIASVLAGEHGGKEHGGVKIPTKKEHGGARSLYGSPEKVVIAKPQPQDIKNTMTEYIDKKAKDDGAFRLYDPVERKVRELELVRVHKRVGKTGENYYSCADVKDRKSGEMIDIDIDVQHKRGILSVVDVRVHKVSGNARYTYDENDNRIPLP